MNQALIVYLILYGLKIADWLTKDVLNSLIFYCYKLTTITDIKLFKVIDFNHVGFARKTKLLNAYPLDIFVLLQREEYCQGSKEFLVLNCLNCVFVGGAHLIETLPI